MAKLAAVKSIRFGAKKEFEIANQPAGKAAYVSENPNSLTAFEMANKQGVYGFLAHNYLAGKEFSSVKVGQSVHITDEDGKNLDYKVKRIEKFQALNPRSPHSKFVNLKDKKQCSASDLFKHIYTGSHHLVLQTCIAKDNEEEWGRMFIIAEPEDEKQQSKPAASRGRRAID